MTRRYRRPSYYDRPQQVAVELERENEVTNNGRGSTTVRSIVHYLRRGEAELAERVWDTDRDKVRQYNKLYDLAVRLGFEG